MSDFSIDWSFAYGSPSTQADFKRECADFIVTEQLGFEPSGAGEHVFIWLEKTGCNTQWVADQLARHAGVASREVGFSGLKDRQAVTRQWFSVTVHPSVEPDWHALDNDELRILQVTRHLKKLKRGVHKSNQFDIRLRHLAGDRDKLLRQFELIKRQGFPNYFGDQRFGRQGNNLPAALRMFDGARVKRQQRSHYLSAARSWLFNHLLSQYIEDSRWLTATNTGRYFLAGTASQFNGDGESNLQARIDAGDIHPAGVMWGKSRHELTPEQKAVAELYPAFCQGLEQAGLSMEFRALRECPMDFTWTEEGEDMVLSFALGRGSYATALLRECFTWRSSGAE